MESVQIDFGCWECFCGESGVRNEVMELENGEGVTFYCPICGMDTVTFKNEE